MAIGVSISLYFLYQIDFIFRIAVMQLKVMTPTAILLVNLIQQLATQPVDPTRTKSSDSWIS